MKDYNNIFLKLKYLEIRDYITDFFIPFLKETGYILLIIILMLIAMFIVFFMFGFIIEQLFPTLFITIVDWIRPTENGMLRFFVDKLVIGLFIFVGLLFISTLFYGIYKLIVTIDNKIIENIKLSEKLENLTYKEKREMIKKFIDEIVILNISNKINTYKGKLFLPERFIDKKTLFFLRFVKLIKKDKYYRKYKMYSLTEQARVSFFDDNGNKLLENKLNKAIREFIKRVVL